MVDLKSILGIESLKNLYDDASAEVDRLSKRYFNLPDDYSFEQSRYDFKYRAFPSNLGEQSYNGHYMVININVQQATNFENIRNGDVALNTFQVLPQELSKTDALRFNIDKNWTGTSGAPLGVVGQDGSGSLAQLRRNTRRIVESIALYMPNTVNFDMNQNYQELNMTSTLTFGASEMRMIQDPARMIQAPINPKIEVLFENTPQRTFMFDFLLAPSNEEESFAMDQIIRTLRFHASPELLSGLPAFMYVSPSEFDITFYNRGEENIKIPRINTCVLTRILVDYAPEGTYSTFRNGFPVNCRLQLEFRELEILTKLRIAQGF
jgi:hypothetical protein